MKYVPSYITTAILQRDYLLRVLKSIARKHYDGDERPDGTEWDIENDDTHDTLVSVIELARQIVARQKAETKRRKVSGRTTQ